MVVVVINDLADFIETREYNWVMIMPDHNPRCCLEVVLIDQAIQNELEVIVN